MARFFWVQPYGDGRMTIAAKHGDEFYLPGVEEPFAMEELVAVGSEIHASKTGLLSALNDVK